MGNHLAISKNLNSGNTSNTSMLHSLFVERNFDIYIVDLVRILVYYTLDDGLHDFTHGAVFVPIVRYHWAFGLVVEFEKGKTTAMNRLIEV